MKWIIIFWTAYAPNVDVTWQTAEYNSQWACEQFRASVMETWEANEDPNFSWGIGECTSEH
jgi:hypothetical protein